MTTEERRGAARYRIPEDLVCGISDVAVRLLDLSMIGAKVEHVERFPLTSPELSLTWQGTTAVVPVRVVRSEIVGRRGSSLLYHTALHILGSDSDAHGVIASVLRDPQAAPLPTAPIPATPQPDARPASETVPLEDTWVRQVRFLRPEPDEDLPYAQFRLTSTGWQKEYVTSFEQPSDGFTIPRQRDDFHELQRTFETADAETRKMMQIALESLLQLTRK
jgi:hypothetical protein